MKKINSAKPMLEPEKQITPMKNEIDPNDAFIKVSVAVKKAEKRCKLDNPKPLNQQA